jgi:glycerol-3-phosphate cytidylyltransferase
MSNYNIGIIAGAFDVLHPGYIKMFKECSSNCKQLFVLLHNNPNNERQNKLKPILSIDERIEMLNLIKGIHYVLPYNTEDELHLYLKENDIDVRFLGDDYKDKRYTGDDLNIPIYWIKRDHEWSTTRYKKLIYESISKHNIQEWNSL